MPLIIQVTFDSKTNIAHFDIDTLSMTSTDGLGYMLASSFESLDSDEISALYALEDAESTHARMSVGVADWLSVAHAIDRHLDADGVFNMSLEDQVILWKDALGSQHASPDDIPGPLYWALMGSNTSDDGMLTDASRSIAEIGQSNRSADVLKTVRKNGMSETQLYDLDPDQNNPNF